MYEFSISTHRLEFFRPAKTSRNTFNDREIHLIELTDPLSGKKGIGEAAPLPLLSIDDIPNYKDKLFYFTELLSNGHPLTELDLSNFPSIKFGLECALLQLTSPHSNRIFDTAFTRGEVSIPINGLVWMNDLGTMEQEAFFKAEKGFKCLKFKIGAHDFDSECRLLEKVRKFFTAFKLEIRLDANGAFDPRTAKEQLKELKRFEIHSIEQPISTGMWDEMASIAHDKIIPIALDEELIHTPSNKATAMLKHINPQFIILKPNLIGGLQQADQWIRNANRQNIDWWATSALESNVGLSFIAQWCSTYKTPLPQGLGTGQLYSNNFPSPLELQIDQMWFRPSK